MKVLVIGQGGREHAIAKHLALYPKMEKVWVAPGNPAMNLTSGVEALPKITYKDLSKLVDFCKIQNISWVFVSPDNALADGLVDQLKLAGIPAFGPTAAAAKIESSKSFAKNFMRKAQIPTAKAKICKNLDEVQEALQDPLFKNGCVVKADGLALGKGVFVCDTQAEAYSSSKELFSGLVGLEAVTQVLLEEKLEGPEVSAFYICQGEHYRYLGAACDFKRLLDKDLGPNTGGMGAQSLSLSKEAELIPQVSSEVVEPLLRVMQTEGVPFSGILFVGLMLTETGPKVLEFNARFGDPETQCLLPLFPEGTLVPWISAVVKGNLEQMPAEVPKDKSVTVHIVKASQGYPGLGGQKISSGLPIANIENTKNWPSNIWVTFAGVEQMDGKWVTHGGRVLGVTAVENSLESAISLAYEYINHLRFEGEQMRWDIGCRQL